MNFGSGKIRCKNTLFFRYKTNTKNYFLNKVSLITKRT